MADKSKGGNPSGEEKDSGLWRDLVAYWILGLGNNFGYVVMLSSAHDILKAFDPHQGDEVTVAPNKRICNMMSTGVILLADIVPSLIIKFLAPFLPFMVHVRIGLVVGTAAISFILVAFATAEWMAYLGVCFTSFSCGLGEVTCLAYSYAFNKNVISTWSSGTGGAGIAGSLAYAGLKQIGFTARTALLVMISVPVLYGVSFWVILRQPASPNIDATKQENEQDQMSLSEKFKYVPSVLKFMIPLVLVYFFEYFINMGLYELIQFENIFLDHSEQNRWLHVLYQIGVFISRSSVNLIQFKAVWIMAVCQGINVLYFLSEVLFYYTPSIWIVFLITLWEGLMGGGAYVNTFYSMADDVPKERQQLAMSIVSQSDSWGIVAAGILAMPVHNAICVMDRPSR